jgi:hypothetical protein
MESDQLFCNSPIMINKMVVNNKKRLVALIATGLTMQPFIKKQPAGKHSAQKNCNA